MSEKERNIEYRGRIKIYTDVKEITKDNVINVLSTAMTKHELNRTQIRNLINFEKGDQPLMREKNVRKDIDIKSISNLAHQITEFWLGYFWGNHMAFVQKSDKHPKGSNPTDSDSAITLLNEMYDAEDMESKDQLLAYYALNILESDLCNDVSQTTQANWWGNDIELDKDDDGKVKGPQAGQWILTRTNGNGKQPNIKGLVLNYDYTGVLANIQAKHDGILERTFTPKQTEQSGGSTTGATSLSSGWTATEAVACKQAAIIKKGFKERNRLALIAIKKSQDTDPESPLLKLKNSDIEIRPIRQKTFDMATKVNSLATMIQNQVHPRIAMETVDLFSNLAEAVEDSVPQILEYQKKMRESGEKKNIDQQNKKKPDVNPDVKRIMQDSSDQVKNSPIKDL